MIKKISMAIPAKSIGYIIICIGVLLVVIIGLISFNRYNQSKEQHVKRLENQMNEQKILGPVYLAMVKEIDKKENYVLPNPKVIRLAQQDTGKFEDAFRKASAQSNLMLVSLLPDIKSMTATSKNLLYNAILKGDLVNFRKIVIALGAIPYVDQIEEINIKQYSDSMEYKIKIRIALAN